MDLIAAATAAVERLPLPDAVTLAGVEFLVGRTGQIIEVEQPLGPVEALHPIVERSTEQGMRVGSGRHS